MAEHYGPSGADRCPQAGEKVGLRAALDPEGFRRQAGQPSLLPTSRIPEQGTRLRVARVQQER